MALVQPPNPRGSRPRRVVNVRGRLLASLACTGPVRKLSWSEKKPVAVLPGRHGICAARWTLFSPNASRPKTPPIDEPSSAVLKKRKLNADKKKKQKARKQAKKLAAAALAADAPAPAARAAPTPSAAASVAAPPPAPIRSRFVTAYQLHSTISVPPLGLGSSAAVAHKPPNFNTKDIWDPACSLKPALVATIAHRAAPFVSIFSRSTVTPAVEMARSHHLIDLRHHLTSLCAAHPHLTDEAPIMGFERWHFRLKWREENAIRVHRANPDSTVPGLAGCDKLGAQVAAGVRVSAWDPMLPVSRQPWQDPALVVDLLHIGLAPAVAPTVALALSREAIARAVLVDKLMATPARAHAGVVTVTRHKHSIDVVWSGAPTKLMKLNHGHYNKLRDLYIRHGPQAQTAASTGAGLVLRAGFLCLLGRFSMAHVLTAHCVCVYVCVRVCTVSMMSVPVPESTSAATEPPPLDETAYHAALFCLLARYHGHAGHGFQAALSEHAFAVLQQHLGVEFECFASPLNCRFAPFGSAYPDTDAAFGVCVELGFFSVAALSPIPFRPCFTRL